MPVGKTAVIHFLSKKAVNRPRSIVVMSELVLNEVEGKEFCTIKMVYFRPYPQYSLRAGGQHSLRAGGQHSLRAGGQHSILIA